MPKLIFSKWPCHLFFFFFFCHWPHLLGAHTSWFLSLTFWSLYEKVFTISIQAYFVELPLRDLSYRTVWFSGAIVKHLDLHFCLCLRYSFYWDNLLPVEYSYSACLSRPNSLIIFLSWHPSSSVPYHSYLLKLLYFLMFVMQISNTSVLPVLHCY